ncbi:putative C-C chemokine receptor type 3 [Trichoplax sp. H2]|nr:putative C-C chemokine receptor type 3 [Trichoplax sp. H2]|eukprot:RDD36503.1 putative C-C chemokine receptor type 3 [Trichoplax sp. H2]
MAPLFLLTKRYIFQVIVYTIAVVIGILGNSLVILVITRYKKLQSPINLLITVSAASGLILSVLHIPLLVSGLLYPSTNSLSGQSVEFCQVLVTFYLTCLMYTPLTLLIVCIYRLADIYFHFKLHRMITKKSATILFLASWMIFLSFSIIHFHTVITESINQNGSCILIYPLPLFDIDTEDSNRKLVHHIMIAIFAQRINGLILAIVSVLLLVIIMYGVIIEQVLINRLSKDESNNYRIENERNGMKRSRQILRLLYTCTIMLTILVIPLNCLLMMIMIGYINLQSSTSVLFVLKWLSLLIYIAVVYNPILYGYFNSGIRYRAAEVFHVRVNLS